MVVVDGEQASEQRIKTQQEQAAWRSSRTGEQAGAAGGRGWGKQRSSQPGCRRQSATKAGAPSGTIKQNKTKPEFCDFFIEVKLVCFNKIYEWQRVIGLEREADLNHKLHDLKTKASTTALFIMLIIVKSKLSLIPLLW